MFTKYPHWSNRTFTIIISLKTLTVYRYITRLAYSLLIQISTSSFKRNKRLGCNHIATLISMFINNLMNYSFIEQFQIEKKITRFAFYQQKMGHQNVIIQHGWQFIFLPPQIFIIKKLYCPAGIKRFIIWEAAQIRILLSISPGNNIDISAQKILIGILHILSINFKYFNPILYRVISSILMFF